MLSPATYLDGWAKFSLTTDLPTAPLKEGTKGRLYFSLPHSRPGAVDASVWRMDREGVVFRFTGPPVAPPPLDTVPRARQLHLSGSWLWTWESG